MSTVKPVSEDDTAQGERPVHELYSMGISGVGAGVGSGVGAGVVGLDVMDILFKAI